VRRRCVRPGGGGVRRRRLARLLGVLAILAPFRAGAVQIDALDVAREWHLRSLDFRGDLVISKSDLREAMITKARPWYEAWRVWKPPNEFDPVTFKNDLTRLRQLYRNRGYYHATIEHDLELPAEGDAVRAVVYLEAGPAVRVADVAVTLRGTPLPHDQERLLLDRLPLVRDDVFSTERYERTVTYLRSYYREHGFARVRVTEHADVDVRRDTALVRFDVESGPPCVFGELRIEGSVLVDPDVIRNEAAFEEGQPFKQSLVERTHEHVVALRLFRSVRVQESKGDGPRVDVFVKVVDGPHHEVRFGVGYDTEEQIRGLASWRDYDFFGGARQLGFAARASDIRRTIVADFLQPHVPGKDDRIRLLISQDEEDEDTYTNDRSRVIPRIEWRALPDLTSYAFYRIEYDSLSDVNEFVVKYRSDIAPKNAVISGFGLGVDWSAVDDLIDPSRGWMASAVVEPVGGLLGGDISFVRLLSELRRYQPLWFDFGGAARVRLGTAEPYAGTKDVPLYERFYAGGVNSVRGYGRRRLGPFDIARPGLPPVHINDPIGGLSLVETSVELRHPVTEKIGGAVFVDGGELSENSFDFRWGHLRYGAGFGARYKSPVGPLRFDVGFPFQPPKGDAHWQVYVSIGQTF
jgi:outer membrane protein assembly complex protein YaeT